MRRRIASLLPLAATLFVPVAGARAGELQPGDVARLILNERGGVPDAVGWGEDVLNALADNKLPVTRENVCAVVAVVSLVMGWPLSLGLDAKAMVLLMLTLLVTTLSLATGRTTVLQGVVHLVLFAVYLFTTIVP